MSRCVPTSLGEEEVRQRARCGKVRKGLVGAARGPAEAVREGGMPEMLSR